MFNIFLILVVYVKKKKRLDNGKTYIKLCFQIKWEEIIGDSLCPLTYTYQSS